ncbi:hypothetical protein NEF87_004423 [Candidatus Lokiarchaeum ossiferum]|uniref:Uncharacterized protein n=1 Tax=Candidatus Lokiarchaeum ossiferum TaxID=2951803 RepID=A0ABY6HXN0_9ARCH|nr:hypothetical protein NEF87_004423 [Candidatus Lokiarchaeum sp. B-35]
MKLDITEDRILVEIEEGSFRRFERNQLKLVKLIKGNHVSNPETEFFRIPLEERTKTLIEFGFIELIEAKIRDGGLVIKARTR